MGDMAEGMLDGTFDSMGEYIWPSPGYPRMWGKQYRRKRTAYIHLTPVQRKIASIRKEIAILINVDNVPVLEARRLMNIKYGKGWRERGMIANGKDQWSEEDLKDFQDKPKR
jgi:hypothetical protein